MKKIIKNWFEAVKLKWILLGLFVYAITIFSGVYFIIRPQFIRYQEAVEKQVGLDDTYINLIRLNIEAAIDSVQMQFEDLERLQSDFQNRLLINKSVNSILPVIDRYCRESKLKVVRLESLDETLLLPPKYQKFLIGTSLLGKYSDFLRLLNKLESNPEWILIESFTITRLDKGSLGKYDLVLSVLKEKETV